MAIEAALRDLAAALEAGEGARRDARLRRARQVVVEHCAAALGIDVPAHQSIAQVIRLAADELRQPARRDCAVLLVHALAIPGLVPAGSADNLCRLTESALRGVLLRCAYPFGGTLEQRMTVLQRLHASIGELMQPMEPTFPNWIRGLHAG